MIRPAAALATALLLAAGAGVAGAQPAASAPRSAPDYRDDANWLCRPGRQDACGAADLSATQVTARGERSPVAFTPAAAPAVDCFYVYPTVSLEPTPNSDLTPGPEERRVVQQQFARFASVCRTYAPVYRQVTLAALRAALAGRPAGADRELAYADVRAAWRDYLAHDNGGRGFVLVGHSQGSGVLTRLIREELDGKPVAKRLVSAILAGTDLAVPAGKDVGGDFKAVPLCRSTTQTGCAVAFGSFRATAAPPADARFGQPRGPAPAGPAVACVNPAAPGGGSAELHPYMAAASAREPPDWSPGAPVTTAFATLPGLYRARCVSEGGFDYLAVSVASDPADVRRPAAEHAGDLVVGGVVQKGWGLHLVDVNLTMGDLLALVAAQSAAYAKGR